MTHRWKKQVLGIAALSLTVTLLMVLYTWKSSHLAVQKSISQFDDLPPIENLADPQYNGFRRIAHFGVKKEDLEKDSPFWRRFGSPSNEINQDIVKNNGDSFKDVAFFGSKGKEAYPVKLKNPNKSDTNSDTVPVNGSAAIHAVKVSTENKTSTNHVPERDMSVIKLPKFERQQVPPLPKKENVATSGYFPVRDAQFVAQYNEHTKPSINQDHRMDIQKNPFSASFNIHAGDKDLNAYPTKSPKNSASHKKVIMYPTKQMWHQNTGISQHLPYPTKQGNLLHSAIKNINPNPYPLKPKVGLPYPTKSHFSETTNIAANENGTKLKEDILLSSNSIDFKMPLTPMPLIEGENVIAMTLYGSGLRYTMGAIRNAELAKENFPGWKLRLYTEAPTESPRYGIVPQTVIAKLRGLGVDIQYMQPGEDFIPPMMWRFLVADDTWVDRFIVRDTDARLTERDAAAVYAWVKSDMPFNCIRDHPSHAAYAISGGMWGGKPKELRDLLRRSWKDMMRGVRTDYLQDMNFLNYVIWPKVQAHAYCSDSVSCEQFPGSHPFPVPRLGYEHVGQVMNEQDLGRPVDIQILRSAGENHNCVPHVDIKKWLQAQN